MSLCTEPSFAIDITTDFTLPFIHAQSLTAVTAPQPREFPFASSSFASIVAAASSSPAAAKSPLVISEPFYFPSSSLPSASPSASSSSSSSSSLGAATVYDTITVGAFAAHSLKFSKGGATQLQRQYDEALAKHTKEVDGLVNGVEELQQNLQLRREIIFSQSLAMCVTAFVAALTRGLSQPRQLQRYLHCGFLLQVESLLSTFGSGAYSLWHFRASMATQPIANHLFESFVSSTDQTHVGSDVVSFFCSFAFRRKTYDIWNNVVFLVTL